MRNLNYYTAGRVLIKGKLQFGGGNPKFRWAPKLIKWGRNISLFWLGTELVWIH